MFRRDKGDRTDFETAKLVLNMGKADIAKLQGFDKNRWPSLNDPTYLVDIDRYFVAMFPLRDTGGANGSIAMFTRLDKNNDGFLSQAEAQSTVHVRGVWSALDRNNDGTVSRAEFSENYSATLQVGATR